MCFSNRTRPSVFPASSCHGRRGGGGEAVCPVVSSLIISHDTPYISPFHEFILGRSSRCFPVNRRCENQVLDDKLRKTNNRLREKNKGRLKGRSRRQAQTLAQPVTCCVEHVKLVSSRDMLVDAQFNCFCLVKGTQAAPSLLYRLVPLPVRTLQTSFSK